MPECPHFKMEGNHFRDQMTFYLSVRLIVTGVTLSRVAKAMVEMTPHCSEELTAQGV